MQNSAQIFRARENTHCVATILKKPDEKSDSDNITSRILWLDGMEKGMNQGGNVDSHLDIFTSMVPMKKVDLDSLFLMVVYG